MAVFNPKFWLISLGLWALIIYGCSHVFAQQPAPEVRALSTKLLVEIDNNIKCSAQTYDLADRLAKVEAELKQLKEAKPKKP